MRRRAVLFNPVKRRHLRWVLFRARRLQRFEPGRLYDDMIRKDHGFALIDLLFVCGIIGILSGIALPRLMTARNAASAASAIASLRVIGSGQLTFAITCGNGFYAPDLTSLAKPPAGSSAGFIDADLGSANSVVKSDYTIQMSGTAFGGAPDTCNALGVGQAAQSFEATADGLDPNNTRFFGINVMNVIWEDIGSLSAIMPETGEPATGHILGQ